MATKKKHSTFTVPEVPGSKRSSKRDYTHAVIGMVDYDRALREANQILKIDKDNYNHYKTVSMRKAGDEVLVTGCMTPWSYPEKQESIDYAKKFLDSLSTLYVNNADEYAEYCKINRTNATFEEAKKDNEKYHVLRWSMNISNASKGHTEFIPRYKNIKVVPCQLL